MRILQLIAPGGVGGAETVVAAGSAALAELGASVQIGIITETRAPERAETFQQRVDDAGVTRIGLTAARRLDPCLARSLRALIEREQFDVVHAHGYKAVVYASLAAQPDTRLFATHHGQGGGGRLVGLYVRLSLLAYRRFTRVFAVSEATRKHLISRAVPRRLVHTLHNFISLSDTAEREQPPEGTTRLVYVGRLSPEKGVDILMQALAWSSSGATLTVVGDGAQRPHLERQIIHLGLEDRVEFVGFQSDISQWIGEAHAAVLPSRTEGLPMTMLEAAALGRPVLATLVGGVPEVLGFTPGSSGTRSDDAGAFAAAIDGFEVERGERIAAAMAGADDVVERFSARVWAEKTLEGYNA